MIRLFQVFIPTSVFALLISEALLIFGCFILAAFLEPSIDPELFLIYEGGFGRIALVVVAVLLGLYFLDLYNDLRVRSRIALFQQFCMALGMALLLYSVLNYVDRDLMLPNRVMLPGSGLVLLFMPLWRVVYNGVVLRVIGGQRVLFVGTSQVVREIDAAIRDRPELGLAAVGFVDDTPDPAVPKERVLGGLKEVREVVGQTRPDRIVVGLAERRQRLPVLDLLELRFGGIPIEEAGRTYEAAFGRISTRELRPSELIFTAELGPRTGSVLLQSIYSRLIAIIGTILTAPIMLVAAIAVKLTSPGPILYSQVRVGRNDAPFRVYKFRSMYQDAEARTGAVWATKNDPRITPLGRFLRKTRIDELPQFFNVLKGEMAIVGPRPERPEFVKTLSEKIPFYRQRHCVKPGITGWAQINHKYGDTLEDTIVKLEYDLYYIKNLAPALDFYIIFHTLKVMLLSRGGQ